MSLCSWWCAETLVVVAVVLVGWCRGAEEPRPLYFWMTCREENGSILILFYLFCSPCNFDRRKIQHHNRHDRLCTCPFSSFFRFVSVCVSLKYISMSVSVCHSGRICCNMHFPYLTPQPRPLPPPTFLLQLASSMFKHLLQPVC